MWRKLIALILTISLVSMFASGCGTSGNNQNIQEIVLYTSVDEETIASITEAFETLNPDIHVRYFRLGTSKIIAKLNSEVKAGALQADLVWTAEPAYFEELKRANLLAKYLSPAASAIPKAFVDKDRYYIGARVLSMGIVYNTRDVAPADAPTDWTDLIDPKWHEQVAHPNPLYSGAATATAVSLTSLFGWDYYRKLRGNGAVIVKSNSTVVQKVASGEYKLGICLDYLARKMEVKGSPVKFIYPKSGAISWASPIAIFKDTDELEAAQRFVDYVISPAGQKFLTARQIISVNPAVAPPEGAPEMQATIEASLPINWKRLINERDDVLQEFTHVMLE